MYNTAMPEYPHIEQYHAEIQRLKAFGGYTELNLRPAFQYCLDAYCRERHLGLVPELRTTAGVQPDGTIKDSLRMAHGYWEAKDTDDDLDAEIDKKLNKGYPRDNIIFEDSQTAVLIQNREERMRANMTRPDELHRLIKRFLDYELPEIEEFRKAQQLFKSDLPTVLENLRATIVAAQEDNPDYRAAADDFLALCRESISKDVGPDDVREMLLQHILTKDIFQRVFAEDQFHRENNIAQRLGALEETFFTGGVRRDAIDRLRSYYGAIGRAADEIADYAEKQHFLKAIYEDFYRAYNRKAADRLGVVYTPNEVVDFIIRGADYLLNKHFGRGLADDNVQILDPATGTGTFVTNLINYLPEERLEYKYRKEIHANEVAILPYYIANLNIEHTYRERMGRYLEFPNLCFVDTLDNLGWQAGANGGATAGQRAFNLGGLSTENWMRVQFQNEKPISVIIGNPPYNANQRNENENNKNREYPEIDRRIKDTYVKESTAQKTKQYDMYKRFIRWASDRLDDDGIIGFVSNRAFLDAQQDDGFRKVAAQEFNELWAVDLKGNARTSGERRRREGGNVFEDKIRVGVAVYFLVRRKEAKGFRLFYNAVDDYAKAAGKLEHIRGRSLRDFSFDEITPDWKNNWLDQSNSGFDKLAALADRKTKLAKKVEDEQAVFRLFSLGIASNRDEWTFDIDATTLRDKVAFFCETYQSERERFVIEEPDIALVGDWVDRTIKWTTELQNHLVRGSTLTFAPLGIVKSLFRPFTARDCYYAPIITHRTYQQPQVFPPFRSETNRAICFSGGGSSKPFSVLATDKVYSLDLLEKTQCLPLYRYTEDGTQISNITEWGLQKFRERYKAEHHGYIGPEEVFAYTYAVLHDPVYRHKYSADLRRELPRLPFYADFQAWARMGRELLDLHIGFESTEPYGLKRLDGTGAPGRAKLHADQERGLIVLDGKTTLAGVPESAWRYRLGSRSALEWVLEQHKERTPSDSTIAAKFDTYRFADHKKRVIDLLDRVCAVSVRTMDIVDGMAYEEEDGKLVVYGDRDEHEWASLGLADWFSRPEDPEWEAAWPKS